MDTPIFHPETTEGTRLRCRNPAAEIPSSNPLRASLGLVCPAESSTCRNPGRVRKNPAPQGAIRAMGGAIPQPVAAIAAAKARKGAHGSGFHELFFVFPDLFTQVSTLESAFSDLKKRKSDLKRGIRVRKTTKQARKATNQTRNPLFLGWKLDFQIRKTASRTMKTGFQTRKSKRQTWVRVFHSCPRIFQVRKTSIQTCFSGPQNGLDGIPTRRRPAA